MADDKDIVRKYFYTEILKKLPDPPIYFKKPNLVLGMFSPTDPPEPKTADSNDEINEKLRSLIKYMKSKRDDYEIEHEKYHDYLSENLINIYFSELAFDLNVDTKNGYWILDLLVELAIDNDRIFETKRARGKPSLKENHNLRKVREYLLRANQLRAYLQVIRKTHDVGNGQLAKEIVARSRDPYRRGFACQLEDQRLVREEYSAAEQMLRRYHRLHGEEFGSRKRRPKRYVTQNAPLDVTCEGNIAAYPWQLSETEIEGVDGWHEEFRRVRRKWLPLGQE
ncbi:hypothetical protein PZ897_05850 [Hoeflea sp. YIM 152468]|uniref:hypothetical protein n=1 Tax=Hoeflea sp. YIM 152468 TaxID=3031759 RepID=UPI0023DB7039|nr:hypothetical protein [Hoeflea sp. YIM 152468]MDF1607696.1 hypothetical protein [Hoeflea sp. YIM 152468]